MKTINIKYPLIPTFFLIMLVLSSTAHAFDAADSTIMRQEADLFLRKMGPDVQKLQAEAVEAAVQGDYQKLDAVRNSRNKLPVYSLNVSVRDFCIAGRSGRAIPVRFYSQVGKENETQPLLVYFHGGGWTFGSLNSCAEFCDALVTGGGLKVLAVDYSLAPEHPYPEGLQDCEDAVEYALSHAGELGVDCECVSVGGDSSGGNLALAVAIDGSNGVVSRLKSIVLYYPVVLADDDESEAWRAYGSGFGLDSLLMMRFNEAYCGDVAKRSVAPVSPVFAPDSILTRLPPVLLINAERDILAHQGREFATRVELAGGVVEHVEFPGAVHLFITVGGQPRARQLAIARTRSFLCAPKPE